MEFDLIKACKEKTLVAAHRGIAGGNIVCNTIQGYEAALRQGADMLEIDISRSADGTLYVFHPGTEPMFLKSSKYIKEMTTQEVDSMFLVQSDHTYSQYKVPYFDDLLDQFKGRCYINIDKFWMWPEEIAKKVRDHGMQDQVLIKNYPGEEAFRCVEEVAPDMPYMLIL
ncbi:MAG: glycerophosphodiester phosphodiesterase family protein, partial [Clostridia bacterium]|nr:glycerophosphodiester phosphodiesterase family protein [Clostridia bacterium]